MDKRAPLTPKEAAAIEALKAAIKALPPRIWMQVDEGEAVFWKRSSRPGSSYGVSTPLKCKHALGR